MILTHPEVGTADLQHGFCTEGNFPPREHSAISGDMFGCHTGRGGVGVGVGEEVELVLLGRGQGCC